MAPLTKAKPVGSHAGSFTAFRSLPSSHPQDRNQFCHFLNVLCLFKSWCLCVHCASCLLDYLGDYYTPGFSIRGSVPTPLSRDCHSLPVFILWQHLLQDTVMGECLSPPRLGVPRGQGLSLILLSALCRGPCTRIISNKCRMNEEASECDSEVVQVLGLGAETSLFGRQVYQML